MRRWALLLAGLAAACGGVQKPPIELVNARNEMTRTQQGTAAKVDPADVHEAALALGRAEDSFKSDPDSQVTIDLAVIAQLKAQTAQAIAATMVANQQAAQAQRDLQATQADQLRAARGEIQAQQGQLKDAQGNLTRTREQLDAQRQETEAEHARRMQVEQELKNAKDTLARIAAVKEDDRGMVVTFQGEALFQVAHSDLLPAAMVKLDQVAESLRGQERKIDVVGHTDSSGPAAYNQQLSEKRAAAVKDYLVAKGIPADLIRSEGKGATQPVAENNTIEGRAANRRVEIIVEPKGH